MEELIKLAEKVVIKAIEKGFILATAESCTGGLVAASITSVVGSSEIFDRGFVTYSYEAKAEILGVSMNLLNTFGAVSPECVEDMALGAVRNSHAHLSVAISGIAGPTGGTPEKPVGLVYIASFDKKKNQIKSEKHQYSGDRQTIRIQSSLRALEIFLNMLNEH